MNGSFGFARLKKPAAFFKSAAGVEQDHLRAKSQSACRSSASPEVSHDHVGEVMHVDDQLADAEALQAAQRDLQQRVSGNLDQRLGTSSVRAATACPVRPPESSPSSAHSSSSRCRNTTRRHSVRAASAICSARYTERCWPPVHPKETIRCLNPRRRYRSRSLHQRHHASEELVHALLLLEVLDHRRVRPVRVLKRSSRPGFGRLRASKTNPPPLPLWSCSTRDETKNSRPRTVSFARPVHVWQFFRATMSAKACIKLGQRIGNSTLCSSQRKLFSA